MPQKLRICLKCNLILKLIYLRFYKLYERIRAIWPGQLMFKMCTHRFHENNTHYNAGFTTTRSGCCGGAAGLPRFCSASGTFAETLVDLYYATMRKRSMSLVRRVRNNPNPFLCSIAETGHIWVIAVNCMFPEASLVTLVISGLPKTI